jgi:thiol:disulfide interchange protein
MTLFRRTWFLFLWLAVHGAAFAQLHEVGDGSDGQVKAAHVTAELAASVASVSRSGVPTYVIYPAQPTGPVQVLPELLTRSAVLSALSQPQS